MSNYFTCTLKWVCGDYYFFFFLNQLVYFYDLATGVPASLAGNVLFATYKQLKHASYYNIIRSWHARAWKRVNLALVNVIKQKGEN